VRALVAERVWVFVLGALSICVPSLVSIAISHSSVGFLGFRQGGYDADAVVIVAAELAAAVFALVGATAAARADERRPVGARGPRRRRHGLRFAGIGIGRRRGRGGRRRQRSWWRAFRRRLTRQPVQRPRRILLQRVHTAEPAPVARCSATAAGAPPTCS
jgi:hypothetical protein